MKESPDKTYESLCEIKEAPMKPKTSERKLLINNYQGWVFLFIFLHLEHNSTIPRWIYHDISDAFGIWGEMLSISFAKGRPGFFIVSISICLTALIVIWGFPEIIKRPFPLLAEMGKNTIIFFFDFGINHCLTIFMESYITLIWLDICISFIISFEACIRLNEYLNRQDFHLLFSLKKILLV